MAAERISVLVCTRNRADALATMLARLPVETLAHEGVELVIVDNGSSDTTAAVLADFAAGRGSGLALRLVGEPAAGLSRARNAALREATGTLFCFLDDDCYIAADYFTVARRTFDDPAIDYAGGRILAHDPAGSATGTMLEETGFIQKPRTGIWPGKFQGASLIVRRRVFERIGLFDPALGAGAPFRCEDIEFVARASLNGFTGRHEPALVVHHDHGRVTRELIDAINRENDVAGGAYFMLCVLRELPRGSLATLLAWNAERRARQYPQRFRRQVKGALRFLQAVVTGRLRPYRTGTSWNRPLPPRAGTPGKR